MNTLSERTIANTRKVFEACDLDGDGFLDQGEFQLLLQALDGDVSREESQLDFEAADISGDGYIEFKEFVTWWTN